MKTYELELDMSIGKTVNATKIVKCINLKDGWKKLYQEVENDLVKKSGELGG
jgi:hypothetical protein